MASSLLALAESALVIVDMQNDFVRDGAPMEVPAARATIPAILKLLEFFRQHGRPVIFTKFVTGPRRTLMWEWSPQCAPPTCACWRNMRRRYSDADGELEASAVISELAPLAGEYQLEKYGYSAFRNTPLADILAAEGCQTVVVTGTVSQICVEDTVRGAFQHGIRAVVAKDGVSSYLPELHQASLANMARKFGWVMSSAEILAVLQM